MLQKKDPLNLTGKVAVVTGGSSGIGLGVVELLSAYGAKVAMVDISPKGADKAKELQDAGREVEFFQCDVTSEESVMAAVKAIVDRWGKIDILHNNAGVTVRKAVPDLTEKEWDFVLDVGLKGLFLFSKHVIPVMEANGGGSIINTGSGWVPASSFRKSIRRLTSQSRRWAFLLISSSGRFSSGDRFVLLSSSSSGAMISVSGVRSSCEKLVNICTPIRWLVSMLVFSICLILRSIFSLSSLVL